jgi:kexin
LEACPTLSWRDVKYLIAKTAIKIDPFNSTWQTNSAGFHHSVDYGFGLINGSEMIKQCQSNYIALADFNITTESISDINMTIPDNMQSGILYDFDITIDKKIEWLGVTLYSDHNNSADLEIYLRSPSGTLTRLMKGNNTGGNIYTLTTGFRFGSVAFMDESSAGTWRLEISDLKITKTGTLKKLYFTVMGH